MVYLFLGQDNVSKDSLVHSKDARIRTLKTEYIPKGQEEFNCDTLYARSTGLEDLQKTLLCLPVESPRRLVVVRQPEDLKDDAKAFLLEYVHKPGKSTVLVLDSEVNERDDNFISALAQSAKVVRFKEAARLDTFMLGRLISGRKTDKALAALHQLLDNGERPERILGGLRYVWEKTGVPAGQARRAFTLLLACDVDIKTGKLKPVFALEKLVIKLCGLG